MAEFKELIKFEQRLFGWVFRFLIYRGLINEVGFSVNCYPCAKLQSWQGIFVSVMLGWWKISVEMWK